MTAAQRTAAMLLTGAVVIVVPVLLVFLALQRHFQQGIATTGIK